MDRNKILDPELKDIAKALSLILILALIVFSIFFFINTTNSGNGLSASYTY